MEEFRASPRLSAVCDQAEAAGRDWFATLTPDGLEEISTLIEALTFDESEELRVVGYLANLKLAELFRDRFK